MSSCKLDHTMEDVMNKYDAQMGFLPDDMHPLMEQFFMKEQTQEILNKMFHLLKKYDLSSTEEQTERNQQIMSLLTNG
jgi:hypothetical protein